jgi:urea transport system permease protein
MKHTILSRLLLLCALGLSAAAHAVSPAQELGAADSASRAELIAQWASAPDPARDSALAALEDGRLLTNSAGQVYLQTEAGLADADSGQPLRVDATTLEPVPVNNALRAALQSYHAIQQLNAADPAERLAGVKVLADNSGAVLLPAIKVRLMRESDRAIKGELEQIEARLELAHADPQVRRQAALRLAASSDPAILTLLRPYTDPQQEADPQVRAAAAHSLAELQQRQWWYDLAGNVFSGLSLGSVLLLAALGLAITFGLLGVINMAHGEMIMLGAYSTYVVQNLFSAYLPGWFDAYLLAALPAAFVVTALVGMLLERLVIRHLYGRPLETLLATWGISLTLIQAVRLMFGAQNVTVANPGWLSGGLQLSAALTLPFNRIAIIAFTAAVLVLVWLLLNKTRLGLFVRAVTQNRRMADSVGVRTGKVDMLAFGLGSGIAGVAGVALSQLGNVGPDLGQNYIIDSFMVVVLGGVGQLAGTVFGAMGLGVLNKILEPSLGAVLGKILILAFIILFIQKRPQGLFALKGRVID